jgi:hypothetical protein
MSTKHYNIVYEDELVHNNPPFPFLWWDESGIRKFLKLRGFDLNRTISKVMDWRGWCWVQRK